MRATVPSPAGCTTPPRRSPRSTGRTWRSTGPSRPPTTATATSPCRQPSTGARCSPSTSPTRSSPPDRRCSTAGRPRAPRATCTTPPAATGRAYRDQVLDRLASRPRDAVLFALLTLQEPVLAWDLAHELHLNDADAWDRVLKEYEELDPIATLPVHTRLVEDLLVDAGAQNYQRAAKRLRDDARDRERARRTPSTSMPSSRSCATRTDADHDCCTSSTVMALVDLPQGCSSKVPTLSGGEGSGSEVAAHGLAQCVGAGVVAA